MSEFEANQYLDRATRTGASWTQPSRRQLFVRRQPAVRFRFYAALAFATLIFLVF